MSKTPPPSRRAPSRRETPPQPEPSDRYAQGMAVRRAVLGDPHVDQALAAATAFNRPFDDLITRYAWGEIWTRPGLPRPTRSLLTIGLLVALNRIEELRMHVRGALTNGVTREEISEVLLHAAVYCGVPAAHAAFRAAADVFAAVDRETVQAR